MDSYLSVNEVRKLTNAIRKEFKDSYLYIFNIPLPKSQPTTNIASAKYIVILVRGFDSFGTSHKKENRPLDVIEKIRQKIAEKN